MNDQTPLQRWAKHIAPARSMRNRGITGTHSSAESLADVADYAERLENHKDALIEVAKTQRQRIAALEAELAAARSGTWQPVSDGSEVSGGGPGLYELRQYGREIHLFSISDGETYELPMRDDIRLCRLIPGTPQSVNAADALDYMWSDERIDKALEDALSQGEGARVAAVRAVMRHIAREYEERLTTIENGWRIPRPPRVNAALLEAAEAVVEWGSNDEGTIQLYPIIEQLRAAIESARKSQGDNQ